MVKGLLFVFTSLLLSISSFSTFAEDDTFTTSHFSGSGNCSSCHDNLSDTSGNDVSIVKDWGASMMANATKDPFWRAKVATELERNAHLTDLINDKCTKCHAPIANYEITKVQGGTVKLFGTGGIVDKNHALYDAGMNGVSCTVCHQIKDDTGLGTLDGFSGKYKINDTKTIYGQYSDIFGQPMVNSTGYTPTYSQHVSSSELCATCHNLKTPYVDSAGNVLTTTPDTEFPEQMPYTEWQNSIFDDNGSNPQSCADCHMPKTTAKVSNRPRWLGTKQGFSKHHLVGANTTMLTMLRDNAAQLEVTSSNMDLSINRARSMLQSSANVEILSASVNNGILEARVKVLNNSGHKAPTAYPSRRMWLNFKVTDSNNNIVFESGKINADGSIVGADNDSDQTVYEPHYDLITAADQVQIYETIMGNSDDAVTFTLLRGSQYLKDNRLTPQGFNKVSVPADVAVHGQAANDANFNLGSDEITYRIPVAASGNLNVNVALKYQTIAHGVLEDLYRDNQLEQVQTFKNLYDAQSLKHETVTSAQTTVVSDGGGTPPTAPTASVSASPSMIDAGQSATISWSSTDATSCTASGAWSGSKANSGSQSVSPTATSSYIISCNGDGGSANDSVTVTVNAAPVPVPTASVSASPSTIDAGQSATISWSSTDANSCTASGAWSGSKATSGSENVSPSTTSNYTITCNGDGGSANDNVTVNVNAAPAPAPTASVSASPSTIDAGQSSTVSWSSTDATSCTASGAWSGSKATSGSQSVSPGSTSTYSISCNGDGGSANDSVTVTVNTPPPPTEAEPTLSFNTNSTSPRRGNSITLSWSTTDATSCTASGNWSGSKATAGSESIVVNDAVSFTLTCVGDGGSVNKTISYRTWGRRRLRLN